MRKRLPLAASRGLAWALPSFVIGFMISSLMSLGGMRDARESAAHITGPVEAAAAAAAQRKSPIHIIQAFCSYSWEFEHGHNGMTSVRSILVAREGGASRDRPYVFHIVADDPVTNAIQKGLNYSVPGRSDAAATLMNRWGDVFVYAAESKGLVQFKFYHWEDLDRQLVREVGPDKERLNNKGFKNCSSVRLKVPFGVAPEAKQALYIDADAIVLCDLERLWDSFDAPPESGSAWGPDPRAMFAAAQDGPHAMYPTPYSGDPARGFAGRKPTGPMYPRGINAGVLMMRLDRLRESRTLRAYWDSVSSIVAEGGYGAPRLGNHTKDGLFFYDQDILNIMAYDHPEWFAPKPIHERYNWRMWFKEAKNFADRLPESEQPFKPPAPCIEHFAGTAMRSLNEDVMRRATLWYYFQDGLDLRPARPRWNQRWGPGENGLWKPDGMP